MKILVLINISVFEFYGYIRYIKNILVFINYLKFKDIFNLYF